MTKKIEVLAVANSGAINTPCLDKTAVKKRNGEGENIKNKYGSDLFSDVAMESHTTKIVEYFQVSDGETTTWLTKPAMRLKYGNKATAQAMAAFTASQKE